VREGGTGENMGVSHHQPAFGVRGHDLACLAVAGLRDEGREGGREGGVRIRAVRR